jgi:hypothetical protein
MAPEDAFASCRLKPRRMTDVSDLGFPLRVPRTTIAGGAIGRNTRASREGDAAERIDVAALPDADRGEDAQQQSRRAEQAVQHDDR